MPLQLICACRHRLGSNEGPLMRLLLTAPLGYMHQLLAHHHHQAITGAQMVSSPAVFPRRRGV